jgi:hypothetical protein
MTLRPVRESIFPRGKKERILHILCVCVFSLSYPACMRHSLSVVCPALPLFSTTFHKRHDFRGKKTELRMCVLIFCTILTELFLIINRIKRDYIMYVSFSIKYLYYCQNLVKHEFSRHIFENTQILHFMKIHFVAAELFNVEDGRTKRQT